MWWVLASNNNNIGHNTTNITNMYFTCLTIFIFMCFAGEKTESDSFEIGTWELSVLIQCYLILSIL